MTLLGQNNDCNFFCSTIFKPAFLQPVALNLLDKLQHGWDDYDEVYHCSRLIHTITNNPAMNIDFHLLKKSDMLFGLVLMTTGQLDEALFFKNMITIPAHEKAVSLNYFHIAPPARGNGKYWLKEILIPHYKNKGYMAIYLKSSHPKAFSLYAALGAEIGTYETASDNGLYTRNGKIFRIPL